MLPTRKTPTTNQPTVASDGPLRQYTGTEPFIQVPEICKIQLCLCRCHYSSIQVSHTFTGILRILNRLINVSLTLLYKYINLYLLKTVWLFTFHRSFYNSVSRNAGKIQKSGTLQVRYLYNTHHTLRAGSRD